MGHDAVLAGRVHALQHDQNRPMPLRIEPPLQIGKPLHVIREHRGRGVLVEAAGIGAIQARQTKAVRIIDAVVMQDLRGFHRTPFFMR
jgi:hypothetical protein